MEKAGFASGLISAAQQVGMALWLSALISTTSSDDMLVGSGVVYATPLWGAVVERNGDLSGCKGGDCEH